MDKEQTCLIMEMFILESIKMENLMEKDSTPGEMDHYTLESSRMV
jgi:hypothetical protein